MLKLVGSEDGIIKDEKVLIDEEGKATKEGIVVCVIVALAALSVLRILGKLFRSDKKCKKCNCKCD